MTNSKLNMQQSILDTVMVCTLFQLLYCNGLITLQVMLHNYSVSPTS